MVSAETHVRFSLLQLFVVATSITVPVAGCHDEKPLTQPPPSTATGIASDQSVSKADASIADLPKHIKPAKGKLALVADYAAKQPDGSVFVYLINMSSDEVALRAQDGDVFLKLEVRVGDGKWTRAQPHVFSWCGNSYFNPPSIRPGHFLKISGYQPKKGKDATIRYSLYHQDFNMSSNIGRGLFAEIDIDLASRDALSAYEADF